MHEAIFDAFDRHDSHIYQFELNGSGPGDPNADKNVVAIEENSVLAEKYPKVTKSVGASSPQYPR